MAVLLPLMAMASVMAQTTVYTGQTSQLSVVSIPGDTYTWELYNDVTGINFVSDPGNCPAAQAQFENGVSSGPSVNVTWLTPGTYFYKVTANRGGCSMNLKVGKMTVIPSEEPTAVIQQPPPICAGDTAQLVITLTGQAPWSIVLFNGVSTVTYNDITSSPFVIPVNPTVSTTYQILQVSDANGTNTTPSQPVEVMVKPRPVSSHIYQY